MRQGRASGADPGALFVCKTANEGWKIEQYLVQAGAMAAVRETTVSLRFHGDNLDPQELSEKLGASPTRAAVKGATLVTKSGAERVARTGYWQLRIESDWPDDLNKQLAVIFEKLTSNLDVWRDLSERFDGNLFVGVFLNGSNEGFTLTRETTSEVSARGLELGLDIYAPSAS